VAQMKMPDPAAMQRAFDGLVGAISQPDGRRSFKADPSATLKKHGVKEADLPPGVLDLLTDMVDDELELISRIQPRLKESFPGTGEVCIIF
jgi:hypothetical protein